MFERPLPPALRASLDPAAEAALRAIPVAGYPDFESEIAPVRVRPLPAGRMDVYRGGEPTGIHVPILAYLVEGPDGQVLVDCGLASRWRNHAPNPDTGEVVEPGVTYVPRLTGPGVAEVLADTGLRPGRLVCTHLHLDHAGGAADLGLPVEASAEELQHMAAGGPGIPVADLAGLATVAIRLEDRPLGPFPRSHELAPGLIVVDTAGHTPGSISLFLCLGAAWALICGDAVYPRLDQPGSPAFLGMLRVRRLLEDFPGTLVLAGHDPAVLRAAGDGWFGGPTDPA